MGEVWKLSRWVERDWLQKSRLNLTLQGDNNSRFFHYFASHRRRINMINSVVVNDQNVEETTAVKVAVKVHFQKQFSEQWCNRTFFAANTGKGIDEFSARTLEAEFTEEEIWKAVKDCDGNKAPGPDGFNFNFNFIKKCWKTIKDLIMLFFKEFHSNARLMGGLNSSFVVLIPKNDNPTGLGEYRPISLVGSIYKIMAKVLATRLKSAMNSVIGEAQSAFLRGRNILDGVLIANEVVDWWKSKSKNGLLIKLDFEKAYDSINWKFLLKMMKFLGFGNKWIRWMEECITTTKSSILINGSPTEEFKLEKGVRQGDPLSPFLFLMAAEALNRLVDKAKELGFIKGAS